MMMMRYFLIFFFIMIFQLQQNKCIKIELFYKTLFSNLQAQTSISPLETAALVTANPAQGAPAHAMS